MGSLLSNGEVRVLRSWVKTSAIIERSSSSSCSILSLLTWDDSTEDRHLPLPQLVLDSLAFRTVSHRISCILPVELYFVMAAEKRACGVWGWERKGKGKKEHSDGYRLDNLISVGYIQKSEMFPKLLDNSNKETFGANLCILGEMQFV